jgi:hypothetical protein
VAVIDIETKTVVADLPYRIWDKAAVSSDGRYVALPGQYSLVVLETEGYTEVLRDTVRTSFHAPIFSEDGAWVYFAANKDMASATMAYKLSLIEGVPLEYKDFSPGVTHLTVTDISPSPDDSLWTIIAASSGSDFHLLLYQPQTDSTVLDYYLTPGRCQVVSTNDGRYSFVTNANILVGLPGVPEPPYAFYVVDMAQHQVVAEISTIFETSEGDTVRCPTHEICVTPDNRWLLGLSHEGNNLLFVFDIESMSMHKVIELGGNRELFGLTCQLQRNDR